MTESVAVPTDWFGLIAADLSLFALSAAVTGLGMGLSRRHRVKWTRTRDQSLSRVSYPIGKEYERR